ncbi:MAG: hypothetical protein OES32_18920 [Acidobacteriota bacterium]|nr:hypothetical protein [Acidobacteriota bacterium]
MGAASHGVAVEARARRRALYGANPPPPRSRVVLAVWRVVAFAGNAAVVRRPARS